MPFESIPASWIGSGKAEKIELWQRIKDNQDALFGDIATAGGLQVPNGSFEIDSDDDGVPDLWTVNYYPGGSGAIETTDPIHGTKAWKFVHPGGGGNGGGYIDSDYIPVASWSPYLIFRLKCSVAGMKNIVQVRYYTAAKVFISTEDIYNSTANPTSWQLFGAHGTAPSNARFIKIRLVGGYTDTDVAGNIWFDDISIQYPDLIELTADVYLIAVSHELSSNHNSTTWTKRKEMICQGRGELRIAFRVKNTYGSGPYTIYGRIYRNGVAVGTERSESVAANSFSSIWSEDISGWKIGDKLQIYVRNQSGSNLTVAVGDLWIYAADPGTPIYPSFWPCWTL